MTAAAKHSTRSTLREEYVEYAVLATLTAHAWRTDRFVGVARAASDCFGHDVILTQDRIVRHVQLKASVVGGRTASQKVNTALALAPAGCVVWAEVDPDDLAPRRYLWFGGGPAEPLPDLGGRVARHTKGDASGRKADRPGIRVVPRATFTPIATPAALFDALFGDPEEAPCRP